MGEVRNGFSTPVEPIALAWEQEQRVTEQCEACLLYTSDAADERSSVDLGGRRIIKKKNKEKLIWRSTPKQE